MWVVSSLSKRRYKISVFLLTVAVVFVLVLPVSATESRKDAVAFWDWSAVQSVHGGGFGGSVTGFSFGEVCASSPDKLHHSDKLGHTGSYDDNGRYTICTCKHCGEQYKVYASDLEQSYDAQVQALPATGYTSAGKLVWQPSVSDATSKAAYGMIGNKNDEWISFSSTPCKLRFSTNVDVLASQNGFSFTSSLSGMRTAVWVGYRVRDGNRWVLNAIATAMVI